MLTKQHHYQLTKYLVGVIGVIFFLNFWLTFACLIVYEKNKEWIVDRIWRDEFSKQAEECQHKTMAYVPARTHVTYKCSDPVTRTVVEYYSIKESVK